MNCWRWIYSFSFYKGVHKKGERNFNEFDGVHAYLFQYAFDNFGCIKISAQNQITQLVHPYNWFIIKGSANMKIKFFLSGDIKFVRRIAKKMFACKLRLLQPVYKFIIIVNTK